MLKPESIWVEYGCNVIIGLRTLLVYVWVVLATAAYGCVAICLSLVLPNGMELRGLTLDNVPVVEQLLARL